MGTFIATLAALNAAVHADGPQVGVFTARLNGGAVNSIQCIGAAGADASSVQFQGAWSDPSGTCQVSWDYNVDLDPTGNAKIIGAATVANNGAEPAKLDIAFDVPICPHIASGAKMGGSCTLKLTTSANGGVLSTAPGDAIFTGLVDGGSGPKMFHGPFNMGSTGSGTAQTMNAFGAPFPGHNVSAVMDTFGVRHVFGLTDGDSVLITSNVILGGDPASFVACPDLPEDAPEGQQAPQEPQGAEAPSAPPADPVVPSTPGAPSSSTVVVGDSQSNKVTLKADSGRKSTAKSIRRPASSKSQAAKPPKASSSKKSSASSSRRSSSRR